MSKFSFTYLNAFRLASSNYSIKNNLYTILFRKTYFKQKLGLKEIPKPKNFRILSKKISLVYDKTLRDFIMWFQLTNKHFLKLPASYDLMVRKYPLSMIFRITTGTKNMPIVLGKSLISVEYLGNNFGIISFYKTKLNIWNYEKYNFSKKFQNVSLTHVKSYFDHIQSINLKIIKIIYSWIKRFVHRPYLPDRPYLNAGVRFILNNKQRMKLEMYWVMKFKVSEYLRRRFDLKKYEVFRQKSKVLHKIFENFQEYSKIFKNHKLIPKKSNASKIIGYRKVLPVKFYLK